MRTSIVLGLLLLTVTSAGQAADPDPSLPHLRRLGSATQLIVGGKPFLMRGGELGNSTATNAAYLRPFWSKFADLNMNTVLVPVYWDLVEPQEGRLDFSLLDSVIGQARDHDMRLAALCAFGKPALRPGGSAEPGGVGQWSLRLRRPRRHGLLAVRHRVDRGARGEGAGGELRRWRSSSR